MAEKKPTKEVSYCAGCREALTTKNSYFKTPSKKSFRIPMCKSCLQKRFGVECEKYGDEQSALYVLCLLSDVAYLSAFADEAVANKNHTLEGYFTIMSRHPSQRFRDGEVLYLTVEVRRDELFSYLNTLALANGKKELLKEFIFRYAEALENHTINEVLAHKHFFEALKAEETEGNNGT